MVGSLSLALWWSAYSFARRTPIMAQPSIFLARRKRPGLSATVFRAAPARVLNTHSPHTSIADLRALLQDAPAHILHLACHGVQDVDPLSSALVMLQDGRLTIEDMLQLDLPEAVLAYLSACQTAKGDRNTPDQAVHLAAFMLFCDFRSIVGTMW
jgi:CHAT domain-containing protein